MKGIDIYNELLTTEERFRFKRNTIRHYWDNPNMWEHLMGKEFSRPSTFIIQAFKWDETPEGFMYWCELSDDVDKRVGGIVKYRLPTFKF